MPPDGFLPRRVQSGCDAPPAIRRIDADVGPVQPVAVRLVGGQPATLDDVGERVVDMVEVEVEAKRGRRANDGIPVESDELPFREQLEMTQVMRTALNRSASASVGKQISWSRSSPGACSGLVCMMTMPSGSRR